MLLYSARIYQNVVNKDDNELICIPLEHSIHQIDEGCRGIRESVQHHQELIVPISCSESRLWYITLTHLELIIARS